MRIFVEISFTSNVLILWNKSFRLLS